MVLDKKSSLDERKSVVDEAVVEKAGFPDHLHEYLRAGLSVEDAQFLSSISTNEQAKIFHKVDWRLCPMLAVLYLISHLDRYVEVSEQGY